MLLAVTKWRDQPVVESPMFLLDTDFNRFEEVAVASTGVEVMSLLPENAAGTRAPENLAVERLCAIGADGRVLWWSEEKKAWQRQSENPPFRQWKEDVLATLTGERAAEGWDKGCAPPNVASWSVEEKRQAVEFMENLPSQERPLASEVLAKIRVPAETAAAAAVDVMVLAYSWLGGAGHLMTPVFLRVENPFALAEALGSLTVRETMALAGPLSQTNLSRSETLAGCSVCLLAADGQIIGLQNLRLNIWRERERSWVTDEWRQEAINAVRGESSYSAPLFCFPYLLTNDWSDETRKKVIGFLERAPIRSAETAGR